MRNARFGVMAGLAGATLCLFAVTSYAQTPATTPGADASAQTTPAPTTTTPAATDQQVTTTNTTTTETWSFPGGTLGILAVAVLVLLVLFALFRGRDRDTTTVVKESYTTPPVTRTSGIGTADDRNINSRAASGPGSNPGGINDPNARR
jgi:hypothetical protein